MAISFRLKDSPSWVPPISLPGGLLPNSLPMKIVPELIISNYLKNMLPPMPKLPDVRAMKAQAYRYLQGALGNEIIPQQWNLLLEVARSGVPGAALLFAKMQFARIIPRNLPLP